MGWGKYQRKHRSKVGDWVRYRNDSWQIQFKNPSKRIVEERLKQKKRFAKSKSHFQQLIEDYDFTIRKVTRMINYKKYFIYQLLRRKKKRKVKEMSKRSRRKMRYHGRVGHPVIHVSKTGRKYIMVRKKGGGTKRLYLVKGNVPVKHRD